MLSNVHITHQPHMPYSSEHTRMYDIYKTKSHFSAWFRRSCAGVRPPTGQGFTWFRGSLATRLRLASRPRPKSDTRRGGAQIEAQHTHRC